VGEIVDLDQSTVHLGIHWASEYLRLSYSVAALCKPVHIYWLCINSTHCDWLCNDNGNDHHKKKKSFRCMHSRRRGTVVLASPSLRWRTVFGPVRNIFIVTSFRIPVRIENMSDSWWQHLTFAFLSFEHLNWIAVNWTTTYQLQRLLTVQWNGFCLQDSWFRPLDLFGIRINFLNYEYF